LEKGSWVPRIETGFTARPTLPDALAGPAGVPLLFLLLLSASRRTLLSGQSTRIVGATAFLHREFEQAREREALKASASQPLTLCVPGGQAYFWWAVPDLVQRLLIVGFAQWIRHPPHRLLFGFFVSVIYLAALFLAQPVRGRPVALVVFCSNIP
jgi:hypothetical protein